MNNPVDPKTEFMVRAIELSRRGFPAPNPHVGCVIVRGDEIVGEGWHDHAGGPHAEVAAIGQAGDRATGATLYVTLEPCDHFGRTPPCTKAILESGIQCVVIARRDPNPTAGGGLESLRSAGVEVHEGLLAAEAEGANAAWLQAMRLQRPFVVLKAAVTLDGFLARLDGTSKWITGERARERGRLLRAEMGAVLVGSTTVQRDNPLLTVRNQSVKNEPLRVVLDAQATLDGDEQVFQQVGEAIRFVGLGREELEIDIGLETSSDGFETRGLLSVLFERGVNGVLVEGGAATISGFIRSGLWDRLNLFVAPKTFREGISWHGGAELPALDLNLLERYGDDIRIEYEPSSTRREHS